MPKKNNAIQVKKRYTSESKTAKLDKDLMLQIGKGTLNLTASAINFMFSTISSVAKDGRIYLDMYELRSKLMMQQKTVVRVINELTLAGLVSEKDGFLHSHFHVLSNGKGEDKRYIRNIALLTSEYVLSLNKNKKRFFLYGLAASRGKHGAIRVSVESLYDNRYHGGVSYIDGYQELAKTLFEFVENGCFVVHIGKQRYDEQNFNTFKNDFHAYCGYDEVTGKKRMCQNRQHTISIQLHEKHTGNVVANHSSMMEFEYFADKYHIHYPLLRPETAPLFIDIQNQLFKQVGALGVNIYRTSLSSYFSKEEDHVLYHDLLLDAATTKAANYMMDFHLIKEIQRIIVKVLSSKRSPDEVVEVDGYAVDSALLNKLIRYFVAKSSDNQKVLLEEELRQHHVDLDALTTQPYQELEEVNPWILFASEVTDIHDCLVFEIEMVNLAKQEQKDLIVKWAKEGLLVQAEQLSERIEKLKEKVLLLRKKRQPGSLSKESLRLNRSDIQSAAEAPVKPERRLNNLEKREKRMREKGLIPTEIDMKELEVDF